MDSVLQEEMETFEEHKAEWLIRYQKRFVLVKGRELIGVFNTIEEALEEGARRFGLQSFLIKRVEDEEDEVHVPALTLGLNALTLPVITVVALALMACALTTTRAETPANGAGMAQITPFVTWSGSRSQVKKRAYILVEDEKQWSEVWKAHSTEDVPAIDFNRCSVVAVFQGDGVNNRGVRLVSAVEGENVVIRYDNRHFQTGCGRVVYLDDWREGLEADTIPCTCGVPGTAYGVFVFPRIAKPLVLEENVQDTLGEPPVWRMRARTKDGRLVEVEIGTENGDQADETNARP
jgi:hypothetical protein